MELFEFFRWALVMLASVAALLTVPVPVAGWTLPLLLPLNVPMAALAYKIRLGPAEVPFDTDVYWWRSAGAGLGLAGIAVVTVAVDYVLVSADLPAGMVHTVMTMLFAPAAMWYLFWIFALEEWTEAVSLSVIYFGIPLLLLGLLLVFGVRLPIAAAESWLLPDV